MAAALEKLKANAVPNTTLFISGNTQQSATRKASSAIAPHDQAPHLDKQLCYAQQQ